MESETTSENRQVEVSRHAWALKQIARQFPIPVIMVSQLNRSPEARSDKRATLADLRESGTIEQDSATTTTIPIRPVPARPKFTWPKTAPGESGGCGS